MTTEEELLEWTLDELKQHPRHYNSAIDFVNELKDLMYGPGCNYKPKRRARKSKKR